MVIRAGGLDRSDELSIVAHMWTNRKLDGIDISAEALQWPEGPGDPAAFATALAGRASPPPPSVDDDLALHAQ
jgi:hypothetical protein